MSKAIANIPAEEAAHIFVRKSSGSYIAASAYLPAAYEWCSKCDSGAAHAHPVKAMMTETEINIAVAKYCDDQYAEEWDF